MAPLTVSDAPDSTGLVISGGGAHLVGAAPRVTLLGGEVVTLARRSGPASAPVFEAPGRFRLSLATSDDRGWLRVAGKLENLGGEAARLADVCPLVFASVALEPALDRVYRHGLDLCDYTRVVPIDRPLFSHCVAGFTNARGEGALAIGFRELDASFNEVAWEVDGGSLGEVLCRVKRDGVPLAAGATLVLPTVLLAAGPGLSALLLEYARRAAEHTPGRFQKPIESGYCSWYYYYGTENADGIRKNMEVLAESSLKPHLRTIQIDDGWNLAHHGAPRVWGDWFAGGKFPDGMKAFADEIHAKGFRAGLWLAPFSVEKASEFYKNHSDLLVRDLEKDEPATYWGIHALDLTNPRSHDFLREVFTRVFDEWGYDYIKIDFLLHACQPGRRHDETKTWAEAFRDAMKVIRACAGDDRFILNCGSPMGPALGLCDGMRIGTDVSSRWFIPMNTAGWPDGNCNVKAGIGQTVARQWMHGIWWQNDPDCIQTRDYATQHEKDMFDGGWKGKFDQYPYGLSDNEAECWAKVIWMTGGMALLSEYLPDLKPARRALIDRIFPINEKPGQVVDWYEFADLYVLANEDGVTCLVNASDDARRVAIPAARLGLKGTGPWKFRELWTGESFEASGDRVAFPELPGRSARLWALA